LDRLYVLDIPVRSNCRQSRWASAHCYAPQRVLPLRYHVATSATQPARSAANVSILPQGDDVLVRHQPGF
jgi:hypothetical protein